MFTDHIPRVWMIHDMCFYSATWNTTTKLACFLCQRGLYSWGSLSSISNLVPLRIAVYCGSQHHSWHVTSVQLVQPKPLSCQEGRVRSDSGYTNSSTETSNSVATSSPPTSQLLSPTKCSYQPLVSVSEKLQGIITLSLCNI